MSEIVVDASAVVRALLGRDAVSVALRKRIVESEAHAPHLVDAEFGTVLRRAVRKGEVSEADAELAIRVLTDLIDTRHDEVGYIAMKAWELRDNVSYWDALYASLADWLNVPLLTRDIRLSKAPGLPCQVELVA
ncbi:PIN domain-containing protein [Pseudonocardiaceae bacterium YIM PH 21723]|nr:PIN domain-containing protein [Pseudonocardiaceae bacterium YIM PH 21723]